MDFTTLRAFGSELNKLARTRAAKEVGQAFARGDIEGAGQMARQWGSLGLPSRYVADVSEGGGEAGVDLMMGRRKGPVDSVEGLHARKLYKPDSTISRGDFTSRMLQQKQDFTDTARALSPEAKGMVPAMYGFEQKGTGPLMRHTSYHEYVPGVSSMRRAPDAVKQQALDQANKTVLNPMRAQGKVMHDVVLEPGKANWGNLVSTPQGPKALDFLPEVKGQRPEFLRSWDHHKYDASQTSRFGSGEKGTNLASLRKEVFKPTLQGSGAPQPPISPQAPTRVLSGPTKPTAPPTIPNSAPTRVDAIRPKPQIKPGLMPTRVAAPGAIAKGTGGVIRSAMKNISRVL